MDDGDQKLFLELDKKYEFLPNGNNGEKTDAFLIVVEIVAKDLDKRSKSS